MLDKIKGARTVIFNTLMGAIAFLAVFGVFPEGAPTAEQVDGSFNALEAAFVGVWTLGNYLLRAVTNTPIFKRG